MVNDMSPCGFPDFSHAAGGYCSGCLLADAQQPTTSYSDPDTAEIQQVTLKKREQFSQPSSVLLVRQIHSNIIVYLCVGSA